MQARGRSGLAGSLRSLRYTSGFKTGVHASGEKPGDAARNVPDVENKTDEKTDAAGNVPDAENKSAEKTDAVGNDGQAAEEKTESKFVALPRFRGLTEDEACALLDGAGVVYTVEYDFSSAVRAGLVKSLRFRGKSDADFYYIRRGTKVTLSISLGPETPAPRSVDPTAPDPKRVYVTIDDGPSRAYNQEVLDILASHGVRATFFLVGAYVRAYPALVKNIAAGGHVIGCHSYTHDFTPLYGTDDGLKNELNDWEKAITSALGEVPDARLFRYPGGSASAANRMGKERFKTGQAVLAEKGYLAFDWAMSNNDCWSGTRRGKLTHDEYLKESVLDQLEVLEKNYPNRPKIILIHETNRHTVAMLDWMLDLLAERGYTFGTLDEFSAGYYQ